MGLGVATPSKGDLSKKRRNSEVICYCNDSLFYDGSKGGWAGTGFRHNESVTVDINREKGEIKWKVNGETRHKIDSSRLKDKNIEWVPYFWLCEDSIAIISN